MTRTIEIPVEEYISLRNKALMLEQIFRVADTAEYATDVKEFVSHIKPVKCVLDIHYSEGDEPAKNDNF